VNDERTQIKACCAAAYGQDAVALLLGDAYHPGGLALTRRLARAAGLRPGQHVVDVASGPGATARLLAAEFGVTVDGVDLGPLAVERAQSAAERACLPAVRFRVGDAERLPLPPDAADVIVCECAFCTFPDKAAAAEEFARVLKPGGRAGITDVTVTEGGLPEELTTLTGWVACIAGAQPVSRYIGILSAAGLRTVQVQPQDDALARMTGQIEARLSVLRMTSADRLKAAGVDVAAVLRYTALARQAIADGQLGYVLLVAEKPA
jgi:SAM-dependent methyltransferase